MVKLFNSCVSMIVPACKQCQPSIGGDKSREGIYGSKGAILCTSNEVLVILVDISRGDVTSACTPIVGVILPYYRAQTQCMSNGPDPIVDIAEGWLCVN